MGTTVQRVVGSGPAEAARRADNRGPELVVGRAAHGLSIAFETRGLFWSWWIHFLSDLVVFSFLAAGLTR